MENDHTTTSILMSIFPIKNAFGNKGSSFKYSQKNANQTILKLQKRLSKKTRRNSLELENNLIIFADKVSSKKGDMKEMWRMLELNDSEYEIFAHMN